MFCCRGEKSDVGINGGLFQLDYRNAGAAELYMLIVESAYASHPFEVFSDQLAQGTCSGTV